MSMNALVIDDDAAIRVALELLLSFEDFDARLAADGPSGLRMAHERRPDVIVLDVMMPGMDGRAVARELRSRPGLRDVPIVFCSARSAEDEIWAGWQAGANSYVPKPFDPDQLVSEILRVIRPGSRAA